MCDVPVPPQLLVDGATRRVHAAWRAWRDVAERQRARERAALHERELESERGRVIVVWALKVCGGVKPYRVTRKRSCVIGRIVLEACDPPLRVSHGRADARTHGRRSGAGRASC